MSVLNVYERTLTSASASSFEEKMATMFHWDGWESIDAPLLTSLIVMVILAILGIIIGVKARIGLKKKTYLKKPKGIMFLAEIYYNTCNNFAVSNMGEERITWGGYFWTLLAYLFLAFTISLFAFPSLVDWLACPLCLAIIMFTIIQVKGIKYSKFGYFKRFTEPIFIFLPINLVTFWAPLISTTMRMFGNALSGTILIGLIQWVLGNLSSNIFVSMGIAGTIQTSAAWSVFWNQPWTWTSIFLSPIPVGILQIYFSLFSGFIQTLVFASLSAIWISQEMPSGASEKKEAGVEQAMVKE
ncbi:MAG: F0F1 ATP synthase subunit A [Bacilli bacterium]|nr:F0F1 ATP synthase subunit A [Bacilli bacterium]